MVYLNKNNVRVSGQLVKEESINERIDIVRLIVGIETKGIILPVPVLIDTEQWETFKEDFPDKYYSVKVSGQLKAFRTQEGTQYIIKAGEKSISCFHNVLHSSLDESESQFFGVVTLKKKFDFDTNTKLYLKRMLFETDTRHPTVFEAMALRSSAPYFDNINEGDQLLLRANFVLDKNGNPPYWRIKHRPEILENIEEAV